jgi:3-phenylpropionate/cinnamic acid dioxygenase small subunit
MSPLQETSPVETAFVSLEQVRQLLYLEADCADEHRFDDWLALWDAEGEILYWVPAGSDNMDPASHISIVYDNRSRLDDRIFRLKSRSAHASRPKARMRRIIGNVVIESDDGVCVRVHANFVLAELRNGRQDVLNGRVCYELRRRDGGLYIASKKVMLINNDEFIDNLSFLL